MKPKSPASSLGLLAGALSVLLATASAQAADAIWTGAVNGTWDTTTGNWSGGSPTANQYVNGDTTTFNNTAGGTITLSGTISPTSTTVRALSGAYIFAGTGITSGSLTKTSAGALTLNNTNTFSGLTDIRGGTLTLGVSNALGAGNVRVDTRNADTGSAFLAIGTNNDTVGTVTVDGEGRITGTGGTLTSTGSFEMKRGFASAILGGSGVNLNKTTGGLVILSGANTYTGTTTVSQGVLRLSAAAAIPGGILNAGGTSALTINGGVVELANGDFQRNLGTGSDQFQITGGVSGFSASGAARTVTVNNDANQTLTWGTSTFAPSTLVLNESTAGFALTLTNKIDLNSASRTIAVNTPSIGTLSATVSGVISNSGGSAAGLTKTGVGTLILTGTNTYNGTTTVSTGGVLNIQNADALGSTAAGTVVQSGAALQIQGGITTAAEPLTINGTGIVNNGNNIPTTATGYVAISIPATVPVSNTGALRNISGDNTYSGVVTLGSASRIQSDTVGNKLTLSGGVTGSNKDLTVGGIGNTSITAVTTGTGALTMQGAAGQTGGVFTSLRGTLNLTGASTYTGTTTVRGGNINLTGSLNGSTGTALNFTAAGTYQVTDASQSMGVLTTTTGDGTVKSTRTTGTITQTFASLGARPDGTTRTFLTDGGTIGTDNKITFTTAPATGFMGIGTFAGTTTGNSYAWYDSNGYVRPYASGDANYFAAGGGVTMGAVATDNVALGGSITGQTTTAVNTINLGANNFSVTAANTVSTNGLLSSGGAAAAFSNGYLQSATAGGELVMRVDGSSYKLTVSSVIQDNTSASKLTKSGEGTLVLTGINTYSGTTTVAGGVLQVDLASKLANSKTIVVDGAVLDTNGASWKPTGLANGAGSNISLTVRNGGYFSARLNGPQVELGTAATDNNNSITVTGVGSRLVVDNSGGSNSDIKIGVLGSNNSLTISDGAYVRAGSGGTSNCKIGENSGSNGNSVTVTGAGSTWYMSGQRLIVGHLGGTQLAPNTMLVSNGGQVFTRVGHVGGETVDSAAGSYNTLTINGTDSLFSATEDLTVGRGIGTNNGVIVENGGTLFTKPRDGRTQVERVVEIGSSAGSNNNYITVTGTGSKWIANPGNSPIGTATGIMTGTIGLNAAANDNAVNVQDGGLWAMNWRLEMGGVNSAVNLGNGITKAKSFGAFQDLVMNTASARVNIDNGELKFSKDLSAVTGLGQVELKGPAHITTAFSNSIDTPIFGSGSLTKEDSGTLSLTNTNTYTGNTVINAGTLKLDGSGSIADSAKIVVGDTPGSTAVLDVSTMTGGFTAGSGQTLQGSGNIIGNVNVAGTLAPGNSIESLAITGNLTLANGATFEYEVNSTTLAADLQVVKGTGNVTLDSASGHKVYLTLGNLGNPLTAFATGTTFSLINYTGVVSGDFFFGAGAGAVELTGAEPFIAGLNKWTINYIATEGGINFSGDQVGGHFINITAGALTAVPEPGSLLALGLLVGSGAFLRSRRKVVG